MIEETNTTNKFEPLPDGPNIFQIVKIEKFFSPAEFWAFTLKHSKGEANQTFFANMLGPVLRVLGCEEVSPNLFRWDADLQTNKYFKATVSHAADKKGVLRQHMSNFEKVDAETIPF